MFVLTYVTSWVVGATAWWISNELDDECVAKMKSFTGALEFSIETQATIGYGDKYVSFLFFCWRVVKNGRRFD